MNTPEGYTGSVGTALYVEVRAVLRFTAPPNRQLSDDMLLTQLAQGDVTALETLYDRHAATVLGIALKITNDQALAENILQETFWKVWRTSSTYQPGQTFTGWLFRIARGLAIESKKKKVNGK